jgi:hypothetical protein
VVGREVLGAAVAVTPRARLRAIRRRKRLGLIGTCITWGLSATALLWLLGAGFLSLGAG